LGNAPACVVAGTHLERGTPPVARNEPQAVSLYETGCNRGSGLACQHLGTMIAAGRGAAKDDARALRAFVRGCDAGDSRACILASAYYARGIGVTADPERAKALLEKARTNQAKSLAKNSPGQPG
jgi:uncharacterized protein